MKYAVAARRRNDLVAYRKHLDAACEITSEEDGSEIHDDDRSEIHQDMVSTLLDAGYVEDAVSISLRVTTDWGRGDWEYWFDEKLWELALEGRIADARYIAASISWHGPAEAYVSIADIQRDDGDGPGATETLQEALAQVGRSGTPLQKAYDYAPDSPLDKAYGFSLIAAAFAQDGDNTEAIDARTRCHQSLAAVDTSELQESDDWLRAARTYAKLAQVSALLEEPEEAKRLLKRVIGVVAKIADDWDKYEAFADIAVVWMCLNEQDTALTIAAAHPGEYGRLWSGRGTHWHVITHPSFSATPEVTGRILTDGPLGYIGMCLVVHHLDHGRVAQAQILAKTIVGGGDCRERADEAIFDKLCELGAIDQAIDMLPRSNWYDAEEGIKKLCERVSIEQALDIARIDDKFDECRDVAYTVVTERLREHGSVEQAIEIAARMDDEYRDAAYRVIIEKQCELGSIEQAINIAARIADPRTELDMFQLIGEKLAKSRSIPELESFLTAQSKPTRLSAAYLGVLEALVTDAELNDRSKTDGDSAAPPADP